MLKFDVNDTQYLPRKIKHMFQLVLDSALFYSLAILSLSLSLSDIKTHSLS